MAIDPDFRPGIVDILCQGDGLDMLGGTDAEERVRIRDKYRALVMVGMTNEVDIDCDCGHPDCGPQN